MRISDWSSDVCSSDLQCPMRISGKPSSAVVLISGAEGIFSKVAASALSLPALISDRKHAGRHGRVGGDARRRRDRKSGVKGKSVPVRVDLGGRCIIQRKNDGRSETQARITSYQ